ncbi:MAG: four helix bundle protein [Proteobacteria bacterium]|nr:four helix bundle protein [Pseudomonadota bacterium]
MAYHSFENLEVWKKACRIAVRTYEIMKDVKDFGLRDQMTRAAVSIASNIAEGAERGTKPEFIRFLHIAKGSAAELRTQIYIGFKIGAIKQSDQEEMVVELKTLSSMIQALIKQQKNE